MYLQTQACGTPPSPQNLGALGIGDRDPWRVGLRQGTVWSDQQGSPGLWWRRLERTQHRR